MSFYEEPDLERYSALPHLSWILNLYPDQDRRCVGYDGETGFRCNHKISSRSRKSAARLLEKMTGELYGSYLAGVTHSLPTLAGLLLCDKIHHNHAPLLVARWDRELQEFLDEEWGVLFRRDAYGLPNRGAWLVYGPDGIGREYPYVYNDHRMYGHEGDGRRKSRLRYLPESIKKRIHSALYTLPDIVYAMRCNNNPDEDEDFYFSSVHNDWMDPNDHFNPYEYDYSFSYEYNYPDPMPSFFCDDDDAQRQPTNPDSECSICLNLLIENPPFFDHQPPWLDPQPDGDFPLFPQSPFDTMYPAYGAEPGTYGPSYNDYTTDRIYGTYYPTYDGDNTEDQRIEAQNCTKDLNDKGDPELTWCRMSCGTNYHKTCIDDWLSMSALGTCPTCRRCWASEPRETYGGWDSDDER